MKKINISQYPYLLFSPILVALILYVFLNPTKVTGDESRYLWYAKNMIQGFYSLPKPNIVLMNGPGYPIILIPLILMKLPIISMTIINAIFFYCSIVFLYKTLQEIVSFKITIIFSFAWALYFIAYQNIPHIMTEPFTYLLISLLIYSIQKAFNPDNKLMVNKYVIITGIILGYIVLTKMIFGYVLILMFLGSGILLILYRYDRNLRKVFIILSFAILTTSPYLIYTYHLTNRLFFWGTGSDSLYWMSTPYEKEYGDWQANLNINPIEYGNYNINGADSILKAHHKADFEIINRYTGLEQDDAYRKFAIKNIKEHPFKFAENIMFNIGRLVFHYPYSYAIQLPKILIVFPLNGAIITFIIFSLIPTFINWRKLPFYLKFLLILTILYLGASAIVTAFVRMFTIIVPILFIWIAFIIHKTITFKMKFNSNNDNRLTNSN